VQVFGRPMVGALRWDAWYAPGSVPTAAVERSLSPPKYRGRFPFFAQEVEGHRLALPALTQNVMDLEIEQAVYAGLDFWAFVGYPGDSPMSVALQRYLASPAHSKMRFCMFTQLQDWGSTNAPAALIDEHIGLLNHESYLRVADGRPVYFLGFVTAVKATERWQGLSGLRAQIGRFRELAIAAKTGDPFFVLSGSPKEIAELAPKLGGDAVGSYVITSGQGSGSYHALVRVAERGWRTLSEAGLPVVPTVMTGWDRRPRVENPVPWEQQQTGQGMEYYFDAPQPAELASHLQDAIDWVRSQPVDRRSPVALVYAWNENDEGGWLVPTIPCDMRRLEALHSILGQGLSVPQPGCTVAP
jgi:hypothetical protein